MPIPYRTIINSIILLLLPLSSQAEIKIFLGVPGYSHYKHNYNPQKNYQRHNSRYNKYNNSYSNHRYNNLSDLYRRHGNKHAYDRATYYRNKYQNHTLQLTAQQLNSASKRPIQQGFNDGRSVQKDNHRNRSSWLSARQIEFDSDNTSSALFNLNKLRKLI